MKSKYDLASLIKTFEEHARQSDLNSLKWKKEWDKLSAEEQKERAYLNCDFSISRALLHICREIESLKG